MKCFKITEGKKVLSAPNIASFRSNLLPFLGIRTNLGENLHFQRGSVMILIIQSISLETISVKEV